MHNEENVLVHIVTHEGIVVVKSCSCCPPERLLRIYKQSIREIKKNPHGNLGA